MDLKERPAAAFARHPWELARYSFFRKILEDASLGQSSAVRVLDVGAGDAWFSSQLVPSLPAGSTVVCWDVGYDPALAPPAFADDRLTATTQRPDAHFDLVMLLDVVEHVEDDHGFLSDVVEHCLAPEGIVLFSVPAWPSLMTSHDAALGHFRRYSPSQGKELLRRAGLRIVRGGGLFHSLTLPRAASAVLEKLRGRPEAPVAQSLEWKGGAALGRLVGAGLALDGSCSSIASRVGLEVPGLSWWALCVRSA